MNDPLNDLRRNFRYKKDGRDKWTLLGDGNWEGDCEDFSYTALWLLSGKSWLRFWWMIITFQACFWRCHTSEGLHMTLWVRGKGWIDNWYPYWSDESRHKRVMPLIPPILALTLVVK